MSEPKKRNWIRAAWISGGVLVLLILFVVLQLSFHWEGLPGILVAGPPYLVAVFAVLLGLSLSRLGTIRLEEKPGDHQHDFWAHVQKDVGVGFLVSGIALFCIELTMHHAHQRHMQDLIDIREQLTNIARVTGNKAEPNEDELKEAIASCDPLGRKHRDISAECKQWKRFALDTYGVQLQRAGYLEDAERQFEELLKLDKERVKNSPRDYALQRNVVLAYSRLAEVQFPQGSPEKHLLGIATQQFAVTESAKLEQLMDTKSERSDAPLIIASAKAKLAEFQTPKEAIVGESVTGKLDQRTTSVHYKVMLTKGKTYRFDLTTTDSRTLDPYIRVRRDGKVVAYDDDSGGYPNALIVYPCPENGVYWVEATSAPNSVFETIQRTGAFQLLVQEK
jgi:hypothetical protein